jgi:hypothetical protein
MKVIKNDQKRDSLKIVINGKPITLLFASDPNPEAANFIKKTLVNAFLLKAV